jgi:ABC-type xylose transport system permease subunit
MSGLSLGAILGIVGFLITYFAVPKQLVPVFGLIAAIGMIVGYFPGNGLQNRTTWKTKIVLCVLAGICCLVFAIWYTIRISLVSSNTSDIIADAVLFAAFFVSFAFLAGLVRLNLKLSDKTIEHLKSIFGLSG